MKTVADFENLMVKYWEHGIKCLAPAPKLARLRTVDLRPAGKAKRMSVMTIILLSLTAAALAWLWYLNSLVVKADQELKAANERNARQY
ncbi:MAG TPA: hypothetical protein VG796_20000 [Verrucomicrobiales bacterium]|nr:hypothetical protein [Verrucomicrobiales bacterium]